jgi:hydroxymethylbilane synthase
MEILRNMTMGAIRVGARSSNLSMRQVEHVVALLISVYPELRIETEFFTTSGDHQLAEPLPLIGGKGVFTEELEDALHEGRIDLAVHSLKDLPTTFREGLAIGATPERAAVTDVLISRSGIGLRDLPSGAAIGTSSLRRSAQLLHIRSDLRPISIRGNVETRLRKAIEPGGDYDAIVLASAGLERLDMADVVTEQLSIETMLPAPGQGALAVQCRDEPAMHDLLAPIHDYPTGLATTAERAFLAALGGGCSAPVAAYGQLVHGGLKLHGRVLVVDGSEQVDERLTMPCSTASDAEKAGQRLAEQAIANGATELLGAKR